MRRWSAIALLAGLALLSLVIAWQGVDALTTALRQVGLRVLWLPLYSLVPLVFAVAAWQCLFVRRPFAFRTAVYPAVTGLCINWLLPAAQIGGEMARLLIGIQRGQERAEAFSAAVVDKTMQLLTQVLFTLVGFALLLWHFSAGSMGVALGGGIVVFSLVVGAGYWLQRRGLFQMLLRFARKFRGLPADWEESSADFDAAIRELYARPGLVWRCAAYRMTFRFLMVGEIWLALHFLGSDAGLVEALIIESAAQAIRVGAFFIPAGVGAQEGGLVALGLLMGMPPETCLAAGLCKRVRELVIGIPTLLYWQSDQARRIVRTKPDAT